MISSISFTTSRSQDWLEKQTVVVAAVWNNRSDYIQIITHILYIIQKYVKLSYFLDLP